MVAAVPTKKKLFFFNPHHQYQPSSHFQSCLPRLLVLGLKPSLKLFQNICTYGWQPTERVSWRLVYSISRTVPRSLPSHLYISSMSTRRSFLKISIWYVWYVFHVASFMRL